MQKIVNELINYSIEKVDTYRFRDATWLIFTEETRWVVELTDSGTLWFNYKFFDEILRYVSVSPRDNPEYITEWARDYFFRPLNEYQTFDSDAIHRENKAVSVVQRGVKKTEERGKNHGDEFEWHTRAVIGKGVKKADGLDSECKFNVRNVMNNGVKKSMPNIIMHSEQKDRKYYDFRCTANSTDIWRIIEEGIKETKEHHFEEWEFIGHIVEDGIKNTYPDMNPNDYDWSDEFKADKVIEDGEKV